VIIAAQVTTKTEKSSARQDGTARASNANKASSKTITTANSKPPRPPVSSQKQRDVSTVQAATPKSPASARGQTDVTVDAAKKSRLEINLSSEAFTLSETVRRLVDSKETTAVFTLDSAVKRLLEDRKRTEPGPERADAERKVKEATATAPVTENDQRASVKTGTKPNRPVEFHENTEAENRTEAPALLKGPNVEPESSQPDRKGANTKPSWGLVV